MRLSRLARIIREHPKTVREIAIFTVSAWAGATTATAIAYALGTGAGIVAALFVLIILWTMAR